MTVGTDKHPATDHREVRAYLARLETAAARLAPGRREELMTDIRAHLVEALAGSEGDDRAVREALDRLGEPDDIVAAETGELPLPAVPASGVVPEPGRWGPLEVIAVLGLTVGTFAPARGGPAGGPDHGLAVGAVDDHREGRGHPAHRAPPVGPRDRRRRGDRHALVRVR